MFPLQELFIKICGITNLADAELACSFGANAVGFIFNHSSERYIPPDRAISIINRLPEHISKIGVFDGAKPHYIQNIIKQVPLSAVQVLGNYGPDDLVDFDVSVIKQFQLSRSFDPEIMKNYLVDAFLLKDQNVEQDTAQPKKYHWDVAVKAKEYGRIILSGNLNPNNVEDAVRFVQPYGIDVQSGVELKPGKKDVQKMRDFIASARGVHLTYGLNDEES
ncbi:MAG: phosphoribosylanthranilate isomerase [Ignavibacteriae bacterium]|nr:MAG: phosphoribosylanthranilate isomerase [Ignavibacteriota bacterium]